MDFATRRKLFNRCSPNEALEPYDERNVDLDQFGDSDARVRGVDWVGRLAARIELSDRPECLLFTGLRGSGKSTELRRLACRLGDRHQANLLVVLVDAEELLDLTQPIDVPDVLAAVLAAAEAEVLRAEGKDASRALTDGPLMRLWNWLSRTDAKLKEAGVSLGDYGSLSFELKTRPTLREQVREVVSRHLGDFLRLVRDDLELLQGRAEQANYQGLLVIVDSLEKLQGMSHNYEEVLRSAERVFAGGAAYLALPVHALYTIPPALTARRAFHEVNFLPMVRIAERDGCACPIGYQALRKLVALRVPDEQLQAQLGPDFERRIERFIRWSGGYPRELVRLVQTLWTYERPLSDADLNRVCAEVTDSYRKILRSQDIQWLSEVALNHYITTDDDEQQRVADRMVSSNVVLRYLNGEDWFELHPAVREVPEVKSTIQAQRRSRES